jgi:2-amino-4-hydroxy-6-hydroxymethyldihydropteridine diphosphokinase
MASRCRGALLLVVPATEQNRPTVAAVALGSNVGDRASHISAAVDLLGALPASELVAVSEPIETEPAGPIPQGPYLNAAAVIRTSLNARELLGHLLRIEKERGRDRSREQRWGPRALDLDLLVFGEDVISEPGLTVPHPRLHERRFVLVPLAGIAPRMKVPPSGRTVAELLDELNSVGGAA